MIAVIRKYITMQIVAVITEFCRNMGAVRTLLSSVMYSLQVVAAKEKILA